MEDVGKRPSVTLVAFVNSVLFYFAAVCNAWVTLLVFDAEVSFSTMLIAVPIIMFIMNIPGSIGNIGIMEFAYTFVLTRFGIGMTEALSMALMVRIKLIVAGGFGGLVYILMPSHAEQRAALEEELQGSGARP
jgi:hypothetical protein